MIKGHCGCGDVDFREVKELRFAAWLAILLGIGVPMSASAVDEVPETRGFSGSVLFGGGYLSVKDNLLADSRIFDLSRPVIDSIYTSPSESSSTALPIVTGEVVYTILPGSTALFLGNSVSNIATSDLGQALGVRQRIDSLGLMEFSAMFSGISGKVWVDPFVEGVAREDTDRSSYGVRLRWDHMFQSDFEVDLTYNNIDLDHELSGTFLGLGVTDRAMLDRNGSDTSVTLNYKWKTGKRSILRPQVAYLRAKRDGAAMHYDGTSAGLSWAFLGDPITLVANAYYGEKSYDAENPVFGPRADASRYLVSASLLYRLPAESKRWSVMSLLSYGQENSDIDFYDTSLTAIFVALRYQFGALK